MPAYWFVFDLDETLTHVDPFVSILCTFFREEVYTNIGKLKYATPAPDSIRAELQDAYRRFVEGCAQAELTDLPLGMIRPGMIPLFRKIGQLKDAGLLGGCLIYSNNSLRKMIEFIRDVIHTAVGRNDLVCDTMNRLDPRRLDDPKSHQKTLATIQKVVQEGSCKAATSPEPSTIFFFDDLVHPDLKANLEDNYIQVKPYTYRVSLTRLTQIYKQSLRDAGILDGGVKQGAFFNHIGKCFPGTQPVNSDVLDSKILNSTAPTNNNPPPADESLDQIMSYLDTIIATGSSNTLGNNLLSTIQDNNNKVGGRRRKGNRKTKKASRKNRRNNRTKWRRQ